MPKTKKKSLAEQMAELMPKEDPDPGKRCPVLRPAVRSLLKKGFGMRECERAREELVARRRELKGVVQERGGLRARSR